MKSVAEQKLSLPHANTLSKCSPWKRRLPLCHPKAVTQLTIRLYYRERFASDGKRVRRRAVSVVVGDGDSAFAAGRNRDSLTCVGFRLERNGRPTVKSGARG
jgi:hypothetical protein